jgi:Aerobic-type carbon monoxide dehydrogenase, small subunit CoxS/CutS homologs
MATIALTVNGRAHSLDVDPATPLLYVLSDDLALNGPKFGCGLGQCGACTVIARGRAIRSCVTTVGTLDGAEITTLEGLGTVDRPHPLQQAFIDEQAAAMRLLPQRRDPHGQSLLDANPKAGEARSVRRCPRCCAAASFTPACCGRSDMPESLGADAGKKGIA